MHHALSCHSVTHPDCQRLPEADPHSRPAHILPSFLLILGPPAIGVVALLGFIGFWLVPSESASMTILYLSSFAALCLMWAGLSRWMNRRPIELVQAEQALRQSE